MTIAQLPATASRGISDSFKQATSDPNWPRLVSAGALITGAVLLATGRRKAGIALTAVGATAALLEDKESTLEIWNQIPHYIQTGEQVLGRIERFVIDISEQGDRIRKMLQP